jgi:hypothetical protein
MRTEVKPGYLATGLLIFTVGSLMYVSGEDIPVGNGSVGFASMLSGAGLSLYTSGRYLGNGLVSCLSEVPSSNEYYNAILKRCYCVCGIALVLIGCIATVGLTKGVYWDRLDVSELSTSDTQLLTGYICGGIGLFAMGSIFQKIAHVVASIRTNSEQPV